MKKTVYTAAIVMAVFLGTLSTDAGELKIIDSQHYSNVFGEIRNYRIFLPPGYDENSQTRYPVIYFFHGHSQRYFGIIQSGPYDKGEDNGGDNIANYVSRNKVIVVKWDGFNLREGDDYYLRPYNIGPVETHRQFPLYFPELVRRIDTDYRTIPDRNHRAVSGLSMGGFMTFWIGGKYPDLVCAAGNFCGSPEFFVGPKAFPVEYRHMDMYKNYGGVNLRLNYGDEDFIRSYHEDMNRLFPQIMDNYEFGIYHAAHSTCGLGDMFDFILKTFENPPKKPKKWHHIDVYPEFSVWGYSVSSNRQRPGFTVLENVDKRGFRCAVREFVPDGELMADVRVSVATAPIYEKETEYLVTDMNLTKNEYSRYTVRSDMNGKLRFALDGYEHDIGINGENDGPNLSVVSRTTKNMPWAAPRKDVDFTVDIINKGEAAATGVGIELQATRNTVEIISGKAAFGKIAPGKTATSTTPLTFHVKSDTTEIVQFRIVLQDDTGRKWTETVEIPIRPDSPELPNVLIADGREVEFTEEGINKVSRMLGVGNGDGRANPGESIVILVKGEADSLFRRCSLYSADKYVNPFGVNERNSDYWGRYDHVGGSPKVSVPLISSDCPDNHTVKFSAEYWLPDNPIHIIKRGKVSVRVTGDDRTAPQIRWAGIHGDNVLQVKVTDGARIKAVTAKLLFNKSVFTSAPLENLTLSLHDDGADGDRAKGDSVFSFRIPERSLGLFTVEIEAVDIYANKGMKAFSELMTVY